MMQLASVAFLGLLLIAGVAASSRDHRYKDKEQITLWVNKVGPYNNPQETYNFYYLPFCRTKPNEKAEHSWGGLGEVLQGNELINSQLDIRFKVNTEGKQLICSQKLTDRKAEVFKDAIQRQYWYELFLDDLPLWGFVGETKKGDPQQAYIFTHKSFDISYNNDRIIHVNLTTDTPVLVEPGAKLTFTYSVTWQPTRTPFPRRFERYLDYSFFEHKIHWFSIINSFMMVIFLTGLVAIILMRTLRKDYARYARLGVMDDAEAMEQDLADESGWKMVHGDVFRPPRNLLMLAACVGIGCQLALLCVFVVVLAMLGNYFEERGTILTAFIVCYALTSFVSGYVSGSMYARNEGKHWIRSMILTAALFPGVCFGIALVLNTIAIFYHSLAAVPFGYIVVVIFMWFFISFPLCLIGTVIGRNWNSTPDYPCRVKRIPSPIPERAWYLQPWAITLVGGLLPFGSIFIEMYFIFTSFWNYKVYYVYGFMLLVVLILLVVTMCVTVVGTYFLLNAENYHWQWTSFGMSASTALYVFMYSVHYFVYKTKMTGFFQTCFYFGYTMMCTTGLALMCGAVGYMGAATFVRTIYRNVKCD